jgi:hypothetical protein
MILSLSPNRFLEYQKFYDVLTNFLKKIAKKCEDVMGMCVVSYEVCHGTILTFDYKDAH